MLEIIGIIAIVLILFFSTSIIEKRLQTIEKQNSDIVKILGEIRDKK